MVMKPDTKQTRLRSLASINMLAWGAFFFFAYDTFETQNRWHLPMKTNLAVICGRLTSILQPLIMFPWITEEVDTLDGGQIH